MNNKFFICLILCVALIITSCSKEKLGSQDLNQTGNRSGINMSMGATQISGIGYYDAADDCGAVGQGAAYAVKMTGDLEGCLNIYIDEYECSPSGTYREIGREHFVGLYKGEAGSFWTTYKFEAKYEGCAADGSYLGLEIFGRCQHPVVKGSGEGVFEGVTGRLDMKDNIEDGNYPYRGHFAF
jgi:hypothetical protein